MDTSFFDSDLFSYVLMPLLIFLARICDVSIGTLRIIFVSKGKKNIAPILGFFEVLIWITAISKIMQNLDNYINYIAYAAGFATGNLIGMIIEEKKIPVRESVKGICELLGLDPLYLANEGKLIAICPPNEAESLLEVVKNHPLGRNAEMIGRVIEENRTRVVLHTLIGGHRILDMLTGGQYPRIC